MKKYLLVAVLTATVILSACSSDSTVDQQTQNQTQVTTQAITEVVAEPASEDGLTAEQWIEDLDQFKHDLEWYSTGPYQKIGKETFEEMFNQLRADIPSLTDSQREWRFRELVYSIGDGHIDMWNPEQSSENLPILINEFEDGYFIVNALSDYAELIGEKVISINGVEIEEIVKNFEKISNKESIYWMRSGAIDKLHHAYFYKLFDYTDTLEELTVTTGSGDTALPSMSYIKIANPDHWDTQYTIGNLTNYSLWGTYTSNRPYKEEWFADNKVLVVRFSSCSDEDPNLPLTEFGQIVSENIDKYDPEYVLFDLRDNGGGYPSQLYQAFSESFFRKHDLIDSGRLFVATNRQTFSAGGMTTHFMVKTFGAIHIGQPTGGSPFTTVVSSTAAKELKNSGLGFRVSSEKISTKMIETPSVIPAVEVIPKSDDLLNGIDPVVNYVIELVEE
ncbi:MULTISPECIES: hypothetical protein [unclassified Fusibacter]|uniref:hypothetical protein n=1 Tax=unclassified Fusibacter TaxID=2624464 RepID=UPI001010E408|nr:MULTISPECIES: hypothetical protein [unclassified Fusibacter]MCK8058836.1 hypothetical protein [Fusibacter sp. A2]NPE21910.1 hypothetical protein [Fusibacter sp. A1]RXV61480.1 hypothetical protein DWB64_08700 [Fusibacter sp. A1]